MENVFILKGLDCANCAAKIAHRLENIKAVTEVEYNFMTGKYMIISNEAILLEQVETIVKKLEPDVQVIPYTDDSLLEHNQDTTCACDVTHHHENDEHNHSHADAGIHNHSQQQSVNEKGNFLEQSILWRIAIAFIGAATLHFMNLSGIVEFILYLVFFLIIGGDVVYSAFRNILRGEVFDEHFLMSIATIGAFGIGDYPEAVAVMLFYQVGEYFQDRAVANSRKSIAELMDIRPDYANLKIGTEVKKVSPNTVKINDIIIVKPGERVPLDGNIIEGESYLDTSALTGESVPRKVVPNDAVLSGTINKNGLLTIEVTRVFGESTVSKILDLVENAAAKKAPTEKFITKFSRYYTPVVVLAAIALTLIPPIFTGFDTILMWLERALTFLVISCPCALVVSVPLGFFGGIGLASKNGILVKGGNYLEALNDLETVVFDKTGTLTKGQFAIVDIETANGYTKEQVIEYATYAEWYSAHPIALAIKDAGATINETNISNYTEVAGQGIRLQVVQDTVYAGNHKLMEANKIAFTPSTQHGTLVYLAINNQFVGTIVIADEIKTDAKATVASLNAHNIKTVMLTGDNVKTAQSVATELAVEDYHAELLPQQKVEEVEKILAQKTGVVMFVGDGINDAPVLAQADLGVSMGAIGSDAAIEASDIVLMSDEPAKILTAIDIAQKTKQVVWQNIILAFVVKAIVLIMGALGMATMWAAVFADVGVSVIAILNSIRITKMSVE